MRRFSVTTWALVLWSAATACASFPDDYNIIWDSQSAHAGDSMPVSGGDIGLNVWVEDDELLLYLGRSGCRDDNGALLKPGRIRLNISPNPFTADFRQVLDLKRSCVDLSGAGQARGRVRVWVEVQRPVIHLDVAMEQPVVVQATYENWRTEDRILPDAGGKMGSRGMCAMTFDAYPGQITVKRDAVEADKHSIRFYHRIDGDSFLFDFTVKQQELTAVRDQLWNPLKNLTWGGVLVGDHFSYDGTTVGQYAATEFNGWRIKSDRPAREHHLRVFMHADQSETVAHWRQGLARSVRQQSRDDRQPWADHLAWWQQFWERSYLCVNPGAGPSDPPWRIGRNYNLFRYMLANNVTGWDPTLFNGGVLTFDPLYVNGSTYSPDHRFWGGTLHAQNQRLVYWPMLKTGDFDMMRVKLELYRRALVNAKLRVRQYWGHDGCAFMEVPSILGLPGPAIYGFPQGGRRGRRPGRLETGVAHSHAVRYNYQNQLEYAWMMLQYHRYSGCDLTPYLPMIEQAVIFFDEHYRFRRKARTGAPLDADGKLEICPSNALECCHGCTNPAEVIAGLKRVLTELTEVPAPLTSAAKQARWQQITARLPELPTGQSNGAAYVKPAADRHHVSAHSPELYPLFPYDLYGLTKPGLPIMETTWSLLPETFRKSSGCWSQTPIQAARLGYAAAAEQLILKSLEAGTRRFPAFYPAGDYEPDFNWGGCGMIGLQEMLMQTLDRSIHLLPAWPAAWDVTFKLRAPYQTVVEGAVTNGRLARLAVTPRKRLRDVVVGHEMRPPDPAIIVGVTGDSVLR